MFHDDERTNRGDLMKKKIIVIALVLIIVSLMSVLWIVLGDEKSEENSSGIESVDSRTPQLKTRDDLRQESAEGTLSTMQTVQETTAVKNSPIEQRNGIYYVDDILIVNKKYKLPSDYHPGENTKAVAQFKALQKEMQRLGFDVGSHYSGFRSYHYQQKLYANYVTQYGKAEADKVSARAGHSEHQSGLAYDLMDHSGNLFGEKTSDLPAIEWLNNNAYRYGFIIRYLKGKEQITGYAYEPWHLRYIGEKAEAIVKSGLTLEEYLGIAGGDYE